MPRHRQARACDGGVRRTQGRGRAAGRSNRRRQPLRDARPATPHTFTRAVVRRQSIPVSLGCRGNYLLQSDNGGGGGFSAITR